MNRRKSSKKKKKKERPHREAHGHGALNRNSAREGVQQNPERTERKYMQHPVKTPPKTKGKRTLFNTRKSGHTATGRWARRKGGKTDRPSEVPGWPGSQRYLGAGRSLWARPRWPVQAVGGQAAAGAHSVWWHLGGARKPSLTTSCSSRTRSNRWRVAWSQGPHFGGRDFYLVF